jgi:hypothetical protein
MWVSNTTTAPDSGAFAIQHQTVVSSHHCSRSRARDIFDSMMHHSNPPKLQAAAVLYTYTHGMHMLQMFYDTLPDCPCRHYDPISIETHMLESAV